MEITGHGTETYLYMNGISVSNEIVLHKNVVLTPVTAESHYGKVSNLLKNDVDFSVAAVSGRTIASQLRVSAADAEELAKVAWNAAWDCLLLGAIFCCEVMDNLQCDKPVERLKDATHINVTNYAFRAMLTKPYRITPNDEKWIALHFSTAYSLLEKEAYMTAVHAMASYKWHSMIGSHLYSGTGLSRW